MFQSFPLKNALGSVLRLVYLVVFGAASTISAWITAFRMKRRIKRALGENTSDSQLTSIATWMKVDESEERKRGGKLQ